MSMTHVYSMCASGFCIINSQVLYHCLDCCVVDVHPDCSSKSRSYMFLWLKQNTRPAPRTAAAAVVSRHRPEDLPYDHKAVTIQSQQE